MRRFGFTSFYFFSLIKTFVITNHDNIFGDLQVARIKLSFVVLVVVAVLACCCGLVAGSEPVSRPPMDVGNRLLGVNGNLARAGLQGVGRVVQTCCHVARP